MKLHIHGHQIETGTALQTHVEARLPETIGKYFERPAEANIHFSKQGAFFMSNISVHLDSGFYLHASADDDEIYHAFDKSLSKLEKQLRRYKRRLKNHHHRAAQENLTASLAAEKIFAPESPLKGDQTQDEAAEDFAPVIIAESEKKIPHLSMSEAAMQLEVGAQDFVIFKTGKKTHLIYRRPDQNIGWLELD